MEKIPPSASPKSKSRECSTQLQIEMPTTKKTTLTIEVPEDVARAYEEASPSERQRAEQAMALSLLSRKEAAKKLREILDRMGKTAQERGLTQEKLEELLDDS